MLDFEKLKNAATEDPAAAWEKHARERREHQLVVISQRSAMVMALVECGNLTDWDRRFVDDMHRIATTTDRDLDEIGGGLALLSDAQVQTLEKIHRKHADPGVPLGLGR